MRETAKMVNVMCMEFKRSAEKGADGDNASNEHTSTTTDASNEDESSAAEVQQLLIDWQTVCAAKAGDTRSARMRQVEHYLWVERVCVKYDLRYTGMCVKYDILYDSVCV